MLQELNEGRIEKDWERLWAPHDAPTYEDVLRYVEPDDVVLEIGAGDFRLARRIAARCQFVHAIELNPALIAAARSRRQIENLRIIQGDAYHHSFPENITLAVLLMRHCRRFGYLTDKLIRAGCTRLVTNARWRMAVELVDLTAPRLPFTAVSLGWYACGCGAIGFVEGPAQYLTVEVEERVLEVSSCPNCLKGGLARSSVHNRQRPIHL